MRKYNINASIIRAIEYLYDKAQSAVLFNGSTGEWFRTTVGVRQGCLLSPTLFNIFLERIICEALDDHEGSVSIGGRLITNFRFADDIVVNAEEEEEAGVLIDRLDRTTTRYKMEIGPDKTKVMTNNSTQKKRWEDNIKEWTGMGFGDSLRAAEDREGWKGIVATSSVVPRRPPRLRD